MLKGFKDFVLRGNVIDLAIAVVIGVAFNQLVNAFTNSFLKPLIQLTSGGGKIGGQFTIGKSVFTWGEFINQVITFLLTAATIYFLVVLPMNKLAERRKRGQEPEPAAPSEEVALLTEIRDALQGRQRP